MYSFYANFLKIRAYVSLFAFIFGFNRQAKHESNNNSLAMLSVETAHPGGI
jgi:hypothetical protein